MRVVLANKELKTEPPMIERLERFALGKFQESSPLERKEAEKPKGYALLVKRMFFEAKVQLGFLQVSFSREIEQWQP